MAKKLRILAASDLHGESKQIAKLAKMAEKEKVDLVIVMVPGLYPGEVLKTLKQMDVGAEVAALRDNKIEFLF